MINPIKEIGKSVGNIAGVSSELRAASKFGNEQKKQCLARGGKWDEASQRCIMPQSQTTDNTTTPTNAPTTPTNAEPQNKDIPMNAPEIIKDEETGKMTGIRMPDGKTFLGMSPEEIKIFMQKYNSDTQLPEGANPAGTARRAYNDMQRKIQLAQQVGMIDMGTAMQAEDLGINWKEAGLSGLSNIVPSAIGYGIAGAGAGAFAGGIGAVPGAVIGATAGLVKGFYSGVTGNIKAQKGDLISGKVTELQRRQTALQNYISAANANPAAAEEMMKAYNIEKALIRKDYNTLMKEANEDLTYWGGEDGTSQLIQYEVFFESIEPALDMKMQQAILKPNPANAYIPMGGTE